MEQEVIVHTTPGWWGAEPFFRTFWYERLKSNWDFGWELALSVEVIFLWWGLKTPCMKSSEYKAQAKKKKKKKKEKKNDSDCNFYYFSLLVTYPNKFVVVCICIVILHGIYSPYPPKIFLWEAQFFFISFCKQKPFFLILNNLKRSIYILNS